METYTNSPPLPCGKTGLIAWASFDFANSAYVTVISTFIFGPYFIHSVADSVVKGTRDWTWAVALGGVIVAIIAPFLGATVDQLRRRKPVLALLCILNVISTGLLFFTKPNTEWIYWALIFVCLAEISFELMQVPYNGMLYAIAPRNMVGRISGWGWGSGYVGGLICLAIALLVFVKGHFIPTTESLNIRSTCLLATAWLAIFYIPIFIFTPDHKKTDISLFQAFTNGLTDLKNNFQHVRSNRFIFLYLIAHLIYIDGLNTVFTFCALFAAGTYHFAMGQIILLAILANISAGIGAATLAWVDDWLGPKFTICLSLMCFIMLIIIILLTSNILLFWCLAIAASFFVGPTQASSRSYMVRIAPQHLSNQLFGMYALSGKITAFLGPFSVGLLTEIYKSQRIALTSPVVFLAIGLIIMLFLPRHEKVTLSNKALGKSL